MFPSRKYLTRVLPAVMLAALLTSCSSQSTAEGPHATVLMRDGTQVSGTVTASTPSGITLMGDDKASHTLSMADVKSISYDQTEPSPTSSNATSSSPTSSAQPELANPRLANPGTPIPAPRSQARTTTTTIIRPPQRFNPKPTGCRQAR